MKILLALFLALAATAAHAVCTPNQGRYTVSTNSASLAEAKELIVALMRRIVVDVEGAKLVKQATDAVVVPAFDPQ